jgi:hypothetical protein
MITHVNIFWVDSPYESNREKLLRGAQTLAHIPGVENFSTGIPIPSGRGSVDDSFAVGITMTFLNKATEEHYKNHPIRREFVRKFTRPYAKRFVTYTWST